MNPERVRLKGMLAELKRKAKKLKAQASGNIALIRQILVPYTENFDHLDVDQALADMTSLKASVEELREIEKKIEEMSEAEELD